MGQRAGCEVLVRIRLRLYLAFLSWGGFAPPNPPVTA